MMSSTLSLYSGSTAAGGISATRIFVLGGKSFSLMKAALQPISSQWPTSIVRRSGTKYVS